MNLRRIAIILIVCLASQNLTSVASAAPQPAPAATASTTSSPTTAPATTTDAPPAPMPDAPPAPMPDAPDQPPAEPSPLTTPAPPKPAAQPRPTPLPRPLSRPRPKPQTKPRPKPHAHHAAAPASRPHPRSQTVTATATIDPWDASQCTSWFDASRGVLDHRIVFVHDVPCDSAGAHRNEHVYTAVSAEFAADQAQMRARFPDEALTCHGVFNDTEAWASCQRPLACYLHLQPDADPRTGWQSVVCTAGLRHADELRRDFATFNGATCYSAVATLTGADWPRMHRAVNCWNAGVSSAPTATELEARYSAIALTTQRQHQATEHDAHATWNCHPALTELAGVSVTVTEIACDRTVETPTPTPPAPIVTATPAPSDRPDLRCYRPGPDRTQGSRIACPTDIDPDLATDSCPDLADGIVACSTPAPAFGACWAAHPDPDGWFRPSPCTPGAASFAELQLLHLPAFCYWNVEFHNDAVAHVDGTMSFRPNCADTANADDPNQPADDAAALEPAPAEPAPGYRAPAEPAPFEPASAEAIPTIDQSPVTASAAGGPSLPDPPFAPDVLIAYDPNLHCAAARRAYRCRRDAPAPSPIRDSRHVSRSSLHRLRADHHAANARFIHAAALPFTGPSHLAALAFASLITIALGIAAHGRGRRRRTREKKRA